MLSRIKNVKMCAARTSSKPPFSRSGFVVMKTLEVKTFPVLNVSGSLTHNASVGFAPPPAQSQKS